MTAYHERPRALEWELHLFGRPLHPELFEVVANRYVQQDEYRVGLHLTPTGHLISWDHADVHLSEVSSSIRQQLPEKRRLFACRMSDESTRRVLCAHGIQYQVQIQVETVSRAVFGHLCDELAADGEQRGLFHRFPSRNRLSAAALSHVVFESQSDCLFFSTVHTFPDELRIVKTQSMIELP